MRVTVKQKKHMKISKLTLYKKIISLKIDEDDIAFKFSERLSRENNWSSKYSKRCIHEYKKFIYLTCISKSNLTPSDQVDQAWHLHLTYTKSYWSDLCKNILKSELHHGPTKGGTKEQNKYSEQYLTTLNLYKEEFNEDPPQDIWPDVQKRFKNADKFLRINTTDYLLIKNPLKLLFPVLFTPVIALATTNENTDSDVWFYLKVIFGVYIAYRIIKWLIKHSNGRGGGCGSGCSGCSGCGG